MYEQRPVDDAVEIDLLPIHGIALYDFIESGNRES